MKHSWRSKLKDVKSASEEYQEMLEKMQDEIQCMHGMIHALMEHLDVKKPNET